ncbi:hypothetical protein COUCH_00870 [Couchioplanes caeruleus]|uniref:hypothetical protein n=1 Tax=Couchioplanes caeruleus TaxID=56438 RepID=UPI0020C0A553|nr:hypothetical protein [Couchioplanes caeruleus]UQU64950.1 hypothetical protein COUCH_00870 [Couchioplanes caeruleus]
MSATLMQPVRAPAGVATRSLTLKEARLLLGMSTLWTGVVLAVALCTAWGWTTEPRWDVFTANSGMASLVLAGFLVLIGHLAASRDHRHGATESARTLPSPARRRTVGLLALVPTAGLVAVLAVGVELVLLLPSWPAGAFDPWLMAVAVVTPMIGAAVGVAVGRWLPSTAAGPLTLFGLAAVLAMLPVLGSSADALAWLLFPVVVDENVAPTMPRPTGAHLIYLVALLVVVIAAALLRHGRTLASTVMAVALVVAVAAVQRQQDERLPAGPEAAQPYLDESAQHCEQRNRVTYCALYGYGRWISLWEEAVDPVVSALPAGLTDLPSVRQGVGPATSVIVDQHWGRHGSWARTSRTDLTVQYVRVLLRMPDQLAGRPGPGSLPERNRAVLPGGSVELSTGPRCSGAGQLRTVIALWLLAQSGEDGRALLNDPNELHLGRVDVGEAEIEAAKRLLDAPRDRLNAMVVDNWDAMRSAAPVGDLLAPFGVATLPVVDEEAACP